MDNRAIGVFDSGLGGLTAVKEIKKLLPNEDVVYFGDTGRVPYGTRSKDTIIKYTREDINFLKSHNIKTIIVACGTVSSVALEEVRNDYKTEIIGVVEPTVNASITFEQNQKIGIIGTNSTINSGSYERMIKKISDENNLSIKTFKKACPLFVPLVEDGRFSKDDKVTKLIISEYLEEFKKNQIDTLILGCTHYPLLSEAISEYLGDKVRLVDPSKETIKLLSKNLEKCQQKQGKAVYYVTDDPESFAFNAQIFLGEQITDKTKLVNIQEE